jgi:hypothetical protein
MAGTYDAFLADLKQRESGGNYKIVNTYGFLGAYQMGEWALQTIGYYKGDSNNQGLYNDWSGAWTGKDGIWSKDDYLNNPAVQDKAIKEMMAWNWNHMILDNNLDQYIGRTMAGIEITEAGILGGAHLLGLRGITSFLTSNGTNNPADAYGMRISNYIDGLSDYTIPFKADTPASTAVPTPTPVPTPEPVGTATFSGVEKSGTTGADTIVGNSLDNHIYAKAGNDVVRGGAGSDYLEGANGNDTLYGDDGNDAIDGGLGLDVLRGGAGADSFRFTSVAGANGDKVTDFVKGDYFHLGNIDANATVTGNNAFSFIATKAFTAAGQLHYVQDAAKGVTYIEGNVDANRTADFRIEVKGLHAFTSGDFVL